MTQESIEIPEGRTSRPYRSELRQRQAEETRMRVIAAAAELFAEHGYGGTTLAKIAKAAGVSPETVQAHGPKAALMIAALEYVSFGVTGDHQNVLELDMGQTFQSFADADAAIDYLASAQAEVHGRSAPLWRALMGAAPSDPELDGFLAHLIEGVGTQVRRILGVCHERGWLRDDVPFDELAEWSVLISSVVGYDQMVLRDGWSVEAYRRWFREAVTTLVLRPDRA